MNRSASVSFGFLDRIVEVKRAEVAALQSRRSELGARVRDAASSPSFEAALREGSNLALIAEVKRRSPSAGTIAALADPVMVAASYEKAGARAISILTDGQFFGGSLADLEAVHATSSLPLLRKDFTIDGLQVQEARAAGAAAILLIVRILDDAALRELREEAENLGMSALVEAHDEDEVERAVSSGARIIGVNSRDLDTLTIDLARAAALLPLVPGGCIAVAESGIRTAADAQRMAECGADAVLVGETLMKQGITGSGASEIAALARRA